MDIEGHEVSVFNSGYEYFKKNRGETHFLLEVHAKEYNQENDFAKTLKRYEEIERYANIKIHWVKNRKNLNYLE